MFSQFGWKTLLELGNSDAHVAPPPHQRRITQKHRADLKNLQQIFKINNNCNITNN